MRKWFNIYKNKFRKISISAKIPIVMTMGAALIMVLFLNFTQYYNSISLYEKVEDASMTYLESIEKLIDNMVGMLDSYSRICFSNASVQEVLEKRANDQMDFNLQDDVNNYLSELVANIKQVESIYIYSNEELVVSADLVAQHFPKHRFVRNFEWYDEKETGEYDVDFSCEDFYTNKDRMTEICFRRPIRSMNTFKQIGYLLMTVSPDVLRDLLVIEDVDKYESIFGMMNDQRKMIVTSDEAYSVQMQEIGNRMIEDGQTMTMGSMEGQRYMFCILQSEYGYYMDAISVDDAYQRDSQRNMMEIILVILQMAATLFGMVLISRWYTWPIRKMMEAMSEVQKGNFKPLNMESGHYEIQELINVYNEMIGTINELIEQTKEAERLKGRADLKALTAQINPHFLYNTFDSIKSLFVLKRYEDAYRMMDALSRFYKINLSKGDDFITIEKNLSMLKSYVDIQQMRFGGEFQYIANVDPDILQWKILKLTLQPLVENAINHGIHGYTTKGVIELNIVRVGKQKIQITLSDNGRGMSEETLSKALSGEEGEHGKSFGLFATLSRLQYCYGDRMVWKIDSKENCGTTITIDLILEGVR